MNYTEIKRLDEETLENLQEGKGPVDECICNLLAPPSDEPNKSFRSSIKRAFRFSKTDNKRTDNKRTDNKRTDNKRTEKHREETNKQKLPKVALARNQQLEIPLTFHKGEAGKIYSTKEVVKRKGSCGRCPCDNSDVTLKHSYANIRITTPDISSFCPCPSSCISAEKQKMLNNIKVTVEHMSHVVLDPDSENSETSIPVENNVEEVRLTDRQSLSSLINAQYETNENQLY